MQRLALNSAALRRPSPPGTPRRFLPDGSNLPWVVKDLEDRAPSPVILNLAEPDQILCFARTPEGETDIVRGSDHPRLQEWRGETDLGTLFASGVLG